MPIATYLSLYGRRSLDLLSQGAPDDYPHPVGVTMKLAIDQLAASPAARDLLSLLAVGRWSNCGFSGSPRSWERQLRAFSIP